MFEFDSMDLATTNRASAYLPIIPLLYYQVNLQKFYMFGPLQVSLMKEKLIKLLYMCEKHP